MKSVTDCRKWLFCSLACFFTAFLIAVSANTCKQEADASRIAPYVLRFHILAESNSKTDQQLKLKVREQVLSFIQENAPAHAGKEELASWLLSRREDIIPVFRRSTRKFPSFSSCHFFISFPASRFFLYLQQIFNALLGLFLLKKFF